MFQPLMFIEYYEGPPADAIVLEKLETLPFKLFSSLSVKRERERQRPSKKFFLTSSALLPSFAHCRCRSHPTSPWACLSVSVRSSMSKNGSSHPNRPPLFSSIISLLCSDSLLKPSPNFHASETIPPPAPSSRVLGNLGKKFQTKLTNLGCLYGNDH
ncbi:hypothetical protein M9H77_08565 [Catharanthus roseus]|uniref:Uncharacterized protein n=1 Tax=Catharanthus roseus TaxID=4058 RepID=A0ACC0BY79_CATRO|nr:hypothetical protein M9H77_08565 [Catharanthus roseus]